MESRTDFVPDQRRWLVLIAYMLITLACEIQWLAHASVARAADAFYAGQFDPASLLNVDALALAYMVVYLVLCIPASRLIDSRGIRIGVGTGALLVILGSILKAVGARSFAVQLVGQLVLAASQPFIINATTALSVRWFPLRERGLAAGLASLAQYLGFIVALGVTPLLVVVDPTLPTYGNGMDRALWVYGLFSVAQGAAALLFIKENPAYKPTERLADGSSAYRNVIKSFTTIFSKPDMIRTLFLFLIGLGVMNALTSMTDAVAGAIGAKDSNGLIGVAMILGGVVGAVVVPSLSDKFRRRKPFIVLCAALMIPGTLGLALVKNLNPYRYSWSVAEAPAGAVVAVRSDIPHPAFRPAVPGRYVFDFALSSKKDGSELERHAVTITAIAGQMLLLDGTERDDGIIGTIYLAALIAALVFGFAVMSAGPLGFQYAAEVSHPAPEAASQGALLLVGQVSGILFTAGMSMRNNLFLDYFLGLFALLSVVMLVFALRLGESPLIITEAEKYS
jgi:FLVCR family feline leukemia virus subgroup C receptor-related protein